MAKTINRDTNATTFELDDIIGKEFKEKSYDEIMSELDQFVGIDEIKTTVQKIINKINDEKELKGSNAKREIKDHFLSWVIQEPENHYCSYFCRHFSLN